MEAKKNIKLNVIATILKILAEHYPATWSVPELTMRIGKHQRTIQRALASLLETEIVEKHYTGYKLASSFTTKVFNSRWLLKQEAEKNLIMRKTKGDRK